MYYLRHLFIIVLLASHGLVGAAGLDSQLTVDDIRHLLGRTGFGASPFEINQLANHTRRSAIESIVNKLATTPSTRQPEWAYKPAPHHWARNQLAKEERRIFAEARQQEIETLRLWWLAEMIQTPSPQTERLVLFWHNHFATAFRSINDQAISLARQNTTLRELGSGNFRTLLKAIIRDPAMLNYLDNNNSRKQAPNENLARELMELFTLGEGNYSETDIKNAARALTGYSTAPAHNMLFQFKHGIHDTSSKTIFGEKGNFNGDDVVDLILTQPAAAEFIAQKFWAMLVTEQTPEQAHISAVANTFRASDYDIKTLYTAILQSPEFWDKGNRSSIVKSPVDLTVGTIRSTGIVPQTWQLLPSVTNQLGQQLFEPPNVAGWPGGRAWVSPGRLLNRLAWLRSFNTQCDDCNVPSMQMNAMAGMAAQSDGPAVMADNSMTSPAELVIRMASEEFDGPVQYKVTLLRGDIIIWSSGRLSLRGGFDTNRFGRRTSKKQLPWRNVRFKLPQNAEKFNTIEIEFVNDKHQAGREKNLFVDWAAFKQKTYPAKMGRQFNTCKERKRSRRGKLLCNGKLRLIKSTMSASIDRSIKTQTGPQDVLTAAGIYIHGVQNTNIGQTKRATATIGFTLADVKLGNRRWHNLTATYKYSSRDNQYTLGFSSDKCWPDCLQQWPACSTVLKGESGTRRLWLPMPPGTSGSCHHDTLKDSDQKLVEALWQNLPFFYESAKSSRKLNKVKTRASYDSWSSHIDALKQLQPAASNMLAMVDKPDSKMRSGRLQNSAMMIFPTPDPAGRNAIESQSDLRKLMAGHTGITLESLLISGPTAQVQSTEAALSDVLTNLAFQLK